MSVAKAGIDKQNTFTQSSVCRSVQKKLAKAFNGFLRLSKVKLCLLPTQSLMVIEVIILPYSSALNCII